MDPQHIPEDKKLRISIMLGSVILFLFSLTQKCYCTTSECGDSIMVFLLGWAALISGGAGLSWLANPLLFASWLTLNKKLKTSMFFSVFAALLSLPFCYLIPFSIMNQIRNTRSFPISPAIGSGRRARCACWWEHLCWCSGITPELPAPGIRVSVRVKQRPYSQYILNSFPTSELFTSPDPLSFINYFCNENQSTCILKN